MKLIAYIRKIIIKSLELRGYIVYKRPPQCLEYPDSYLNIDISILLEAFVTRYQQIPRILQIGANDGKDHDNLNSVLTRYNWPAILVEPQPDVFEELQQTYSGYSNVHLVNKAIGKSKGESCLYRLNSKYSHLYMHRPDGIASFDKNHVLKHLKKQHYQHQDLVEKVSINVDTIDNIIDQSGFKSIDAILIDTEGYDWEILKLFNISCRKPSIVQYEYCHLKRQDHSDALNTLSSLGYQLFISKTDVIARHFD